MEMEYVGDSEGEAEDHAEDAGPVNRISSVHQLVLSCGISARVIPLPIYTCHAITLSAVLCVCPLRLERAY